MNVEEAYNNWADQYDTNMNRTRDIEALALRDKLTNISFDTCLEIGCGTGKNTEWLLTKAQQVIAVDLSNKMLIKAKKKITSDKVRFIQADINQPWLFTSKQFELLSFSLVLEHIEDIDHVLREASTKLLSGGHLYIGELHPFKQYSGSKARFDTENGEQIVPCYNHHVSDFIRSARKFGFEVLDIDEYFDNNDRQTLPRILTLIFNYKRV